MMVAYTKSILTTHKPMKKLTTIFFAIASAFMLSSCGDSKDKVFDDAMDLMEEMIAATAKGDEAKMKELEKKAEDKKIVTLETGLHFNLLPSTDLH